MCFLKSFACGLCLLNWNISVIVNKMWFFANFVADTLICFEGNVYSNNCLKVVRINLEHKTASQSSFNIVADRNEFWSVWKRT